MQAKYPITEPPMTVSIDKKKFLILELTFENEATQRTITAAKHAKLAMIITFENGYKYGYFQPS